MQFQRYTGNNDAVNAQPTLTVYAIPTQHSQKLLRAPRLRRKQNRHPDAIGSDL